MKAVLSLLVLLLASLWGGAAGAQATDWTRAVAATPEGGFRMGDPAARVKIVEYASLTCPHCAHFAEEGMDPILAKVRTGNVSYEFRNFVLNGIDAAATLVARCGGTRAFFPLTHHFFGTQRQWVGKVSGANAEAKAALKALPDSQRLSRIAEMGGMIDMAAKAGLTREQVLACTADPAALERLGQMAEAAHAAGVTGTPTFFINGRRVPANTWADLAPLIQQAGG